MVATLHDSGLVPIGFSVKSRMSGGCYTRRLFGVTPFVPSQCTPGPLRASPEHSPFAISGERLVFTTGNNTGANQDHLQVISLSWAIWLAHNGCLERGRVFPVLSHVAWPMDDAFWPHEHHGYLGDMRRTKVISHL